MHLATEEVGEFQVATMVVLQMQIPLELHQRQLCHLLLNSLLMRAY
jgi:hypothetical protein